MVTVGACGEELAVLVGGREALEAGAEDLQCSLAGVHAICGDPDFPLVTFALIELVFGLFPLSY